MIVSDDVPPDLRMESRSPYDLLLEGLGRNLDTGLPPEKVTQASDAIVLAACTSLHIEIILAIEDKDDL